MLSRNKKLLSSGTHLAADLCYCAIEGIDHLHTAFACLTYLGGRACPAAETTVVPVGLEIHAAVIALGGSANTESGRIISYYPGYIHDTRTGEGIKRFLIIVIFYRALTLNIVTGSQSLSMDIFCAIVHGILLVHS